MFRGITLSLLALGLLASTGARARGSAVPRFDEPAYARAQRFVTVGTRRINLYCTGSGAPAVILESGLGTSTTLAWRYLQPLVARTHRVCSYDRAGWGFSDAGPPPRTSGAIAAELHALVHAARLPPPYVLVGHSFGGYTVRIFADRFPAEVAGIVLVDPSEEDFDARSSRIYGEPDAASADDDTARTQRCVAAAHAGTLRRGNPAYAPCMSLWPPVALTTRLLQAALDAQHARPAQWDAYASETENFASASAAEVRRARRNLGAIPLAVLTADRQDWSADGVSRAQESALRRLWIRLHQQFAQRSTRGTHAIVAGAGHEIQVDRPDAVARAIDRVASGP